MSEKKKYEFTGEQIKHLGKILYQIRAIKDFGTIKKGDIGGWIEKEENLSHYNDCWVCENARVYCDARVYGDAWVYGNAWVYENARVSGNARVYGDAWVYDDAWVYGNARIMSVNDYATISNFGSQNRTTTFQMCKDDIVRVKCGCFWGAINEFRNKVKETHKNSYLAQEYLMIADLMEFRFNNRQNKGEQKLKE